VNIESILTVKQDNKYATERVFLFSNRSLEASSELLARDGHRRRKEDEAASILFGVFRSKHSVNSHPMMKEVEIRFESGELVMDLSSPA